jgi:hypothetical protein
MANEEWDRIKEDQRKLADIRRAKLNRSLKRKNAEQDKRELLKQDLEQYQPEPGLAANIRGKKSTWRGGIGF